jgi:hypothetical protein
MTSPGVTQVSSDAVTVASPLDHQVDTIWQMAQASFSANGESIVLPLEYEKLLSQNTIEELKARLGYDHLAFT